MPRGNDVSTLRPERGKATQVTWLYRYGKLCVALGRLLEPAVGLRTCRADVKIQLYPWLRLPPLRVVGLRSLG